MKRISERMIALLVMLSLILIFTPSVVLGNEQSEDSDQGLNTLSSDEATSVTLSVTSVTIPCAKYSPVITVTVNPSTADQTVTWESSDPSVVRYIDGTNRFFGLYPGTATMTAKTKNGKSASCQVTVLKPDVTRIELNKVYAELWNGETLSLTATIEPYMADQTVTWSSSNPSVATVSNGTVTAKSLGTAMIEVTANNGISTVCEVVVRGAKPTSVTLSKSTATMYVGSTLALTAKVYPTGSDQNVTWITTDSAIATVSNGTVKAIAPGPVTIIARAAGGKIAVCDITVKSSTNAVYRLYNPSTNEHLYTTDANEYDTLWRKHGWGKEGIGWYAPVSGTAVYRLYQPGLGNHLYTTDTNEVKALTSKYGWKKDNNGKPVFYSGGSISIYRVYNKGLNGMHHLTTNSNEYNTLPTYGWKKEGVKLYASKVGNTLSKTSYYGK